MLQIDQDSLLTQLMKCSADSFYQKWLKIIPNISEVTENDMVSFREMNDFQEDN